MTLEDYDVAIRAGYRAQRELERVQIATLGSGLSEADHAFKVAVAEAQVALSRAMQKAFDNERQLMLQGEQV
jgi:hypothetical protein